MRSVNDIIRLCDAIRTSRKLLLQQWASLEQPSETQQSDITEPCEWHYNSAVCQIIERNKDSIAVLLTPEEYGSCLSEQFSFGPIGMRTWKEKVTLHCFDVRLVADYG